MFMEGIITAIHGDVVEIEFSAGLPNINDALIVKKQNKAGIILEVHDHISHTTAKAIALGFTQGLKRGMTVNEYIQEGRVLQSYFYLYIYL